MITYFWAVGIVFTVFVFAGKAGLVCLQQGCKKDG
jgi:hypothetical protein